MEQRCRRADLIGRATRAGFPPPLSELVVPCLYTAEMHESRRTLPSDYGSSGRSLGADEINALADVVRSGRLTSTGGSAVRAFESTFGSVFNTPYVYACSSGTAAIHAAIAAIDPEPGDEVITTPLTDMGALAPILFQGAIPVFADVDARTGNITAETIRQRISDRTRAIVVTHLFGNPCDMRDIMHLAEARSIPVVEDCAQSLLARYDGQLTGTIGSIGCFSLQQTKHITTGEGGLAITRDQRFAHRISLFINKGMSYEDASPDHVSLGLNYRMTELQGAVAIAQMRKLPGLVGRRIAAATSLTALISETPGVAPPSITPRSECSYWRYPLGIDPSALPGGPNALRVALAAHGLTVPATLHFRKPAFDCEVFRRKKTFGNSSYPFNLARPEAIAYDPHLFPGVATANQCLLVLGFNEHYTTDVISFVAGALKCAIETITQARI